MLLIATLYVDGRDWENAPDVEVEFENVKEIHRDNLFFTVIKDNNDQHAIRIGSIKKFTLINN